MKLRQNKRERAVIEFYQNKGYEVIGKGWPDLLCYKEGKLTLIEVKRKQRRPSVQRGLTLTQIRVHELLKEAGLDVRVVYL